MPPKPAGPGFPLEAPSKFSLKTPSGGGDQCKGGMGRGLILRVGMKAIQMFQFFQMEISLGFLGYSSSVDEWRARDSWRLLLKGIHIWSRVETWFLKIRLFLSFQRDQNTRPGRSDHRALRRGERKGRGGHLRRMLVISPMGLFFWHRKLHFSQKELARGQSSKRCWIVSSFWRQLGHWEGPKNPHLTRLSQVRIHLWLRSHRKVEILGQVNLF